MRRPTYSDCTDDTGSFDAECYEEAMGNYADEQRDREIEQRWEEEEKRHKTTKQKKEYS